MASLAQRQRRQAQRHANRFPALIKSATADDVSEAIGKRCRAPFRLWKRGDGLFLDTIAEAPLERKDAGAMSATFCISTPRPDREEDVIVPEGVVFDDYRLNPLVMWDHGFTNLTLPIGHSATPEGDLAITVTPGKSIDATCYFSQSLLEAAQIYALVDEGILRAASIHVDPIDAIVRAQGMERPGLLVNASNMIEWSICAMGCNPDAVRKALSHGRLAGKPIVESLAKSLSGQAAPSQVWSNGKSFTQEKNMADDNDELEKMRKALDDEKAELDKRRKSLEDDEQKAKRRKALEDGDEMKRLRKEYAEDDDQAKRKSLASAIKSLYKDNGLSEEDANIPQEPGETKSDDEPKTDEGDRPLGSQILAAAHSAINDVADQLEQAAKPLENPEVKEYTDGLMNSLRGHAGEIKDLHDAQYPDHPALEKDEADGDGGVNNDPPEASGMMKFLARSKNDRLALRGIGSELLKLSERAGLAKQYREKLASLSRSIAGLSKRAETKSKTIGQEDTNHAAIQRLDVLESKVDKMCDALANAIPANRR